MGLDGCRNKLDVLLNILKTLYTCIIYHNMTRGLVWSHTYLLFHDIAFFSKGFSSTWIILEINVYIDIRVYVIQHIRVYTWVKSFIPALAPKCWHSETRSPNEPSWDCEAAKASEAQLTRKCFAYAKFWQYVHYTWGWLSKYFKMDMHGLPWVMNYMRQPS